MAPTLSSRRRGPVASAPQPDVWLHIRRALRLSDRELQIVQGIWEYQEQESIAHALGISPDVVYRTTQRIYVKLRIGSRIELRAKVRSEYLAFEAIQVLPEKALRAG